jgi:hypothetical protein
MGALLSGTDDWTIVLWFMTFDFASAIPEERASAVTAVIATDEILVIDMVSFLARGLR